MTKREWQLAIPLLMGFALCLAAFVHGQQLADPSGGIAALRVFNTAEGERVAVVANHALHVLDADGHRVVRQDLHALGLAERPNDMDWTVDDQQRVEAWFFDDATVPRVRRCAWSMEHMQLVDCRDAMVGSQLKANALSRAVHLAVDRGGQRVFIADANGDRVQVFDLAGKALASTDPQAVPLFFPNRLRFKGINDITSVGPIYEFSPEEAVFYHFSYARSSKAMDEKFVTFSHAHQILPDWVEKVWRPWPNNREMENIHPVDPPKFPKALKVSTDDFPEILKSHPYYGIDLIP